MYVGVIRFTQRDLCVATLSWIVMSVAWAGSAQGAARVNVNVTRIGFPTIAGPHVVRPSAWAPIIVDIDLLDQQPFDGWVRIGQRDGDGDECYDRLDVHLLPETGGSQRLVLYTLPHPLARREGFVIELFDAEGQAVEVVCQGELTTRATSAAESPQRISDDTQLIVDLSAGVLGRLQDLSGEDQRDLLERPVVISHMAPVELPELWIGLEAVDIIIWDDADPSALTERQLTALLTWVRQGGTLLVAAAGTIGAIELSHPLMAVLPVDIGEVVSVNDLPRVRRELLGYQESRSAQAYQCFPSPVPVVTCVRREGSRLVERETESPTDLITSRREGSGRVIFCGVSLRDLFSAPGQATAFFRKALLLGLHTKVDDGRYYNQGESLFGYVASAISFSTRASLYLLLAGVFSVAYVLASTFGVWGFLGKRWGRKHSWSAFAGVGVVASVLSVIGVNAVQGFGETLHQMSFIDMDAGEAHGRATALFGLRASSDTRLDLWLPADSLSATEPGETTCLLRPVSIGAMFTMKQPSFSDPEDYRLVPASALIEDVRLRATLKQFEGRWEGRVGGRVTGQISVQHMGEPMNWRITPDSYIMNELGVDLRRCYLLHAVYDIHNAREEGAFQDAYNRGDSIYAYPIGDVPADGTKLMLAPRCYRPRKKQTIYEWMRTNTLGDAQKVWSGRFRRLSNLGMTGNRADFTLGLEQNALLLLSSIGEMKPNIRFTGTVRWSRDRLRQLDLREQLRRDCVYLIGFADDPGPIRLFRRAGDRPFRLLEPQKGKASTMYRIRIPVTIKPGSPARSDPDPYEAAIDGR